MDGVERRSRYLAGVGGYRWGVCAVRWAIRGARWRVGTGVAARTGRLLERLGVAGADAGLTARCPGPGGVVQRPHAPGDAAQLADRATPVAGIAGGMGARRHTPVRAAGRRRDAAAVGRRGGPLQR